VLEALVDLEELDVSSATLPGLYERLSAWLPSLIEHKCGVGVRGGFLQRVQEGTWPGHIMEHVALELHSLAGLDVMFGKTREVTPAGVYKVVMRCVDQRLGQACLLAARDLVLAAIYDRPFDLPGVLANLKDLLDSARLEPGLQALEEVATARELPVRRLEDRSGLMLGQGRKVRRLGGDRDLPKGATPEAFLDLLFPAGDQGRIPLASILGGGQRTCVARLLGDLLEAAGHRTGVASGEGLYLGGKLLEPGDWANRGSAWSLLVDPTVEAAVLEASGPSVAFEGLGFDRCQVAVVTGLTGETPVNAANEGHLDGVFEIRRCGVDVLLPSGTAVLDAQDPKAAELAALSAGEVVYYSQDPNNDLLGRHLAGGGRGVTLQGEHLALVHGATVILVAKWSTMMQNSAASAGASVTSVLAAVAAAWSLGAIHTGLSPEKGY
jgi:hypothetical protein